MGYLKFGKNSAGNLYNHLLKWVVRVWGVLKIQGIQINCCGADGGDDVQ